MLLWSCQVYFLPLYRDLGNFQLLNNVTMNVSGIFLFTVSTINVSTEYSLDVDWNRFGSKVDLAAKTIPGHVLLIKPY